MSKPALTLVAIGGVVIGAVATQLLSSSSSAPNTAITDTAATELQLGERHHGEITSSSELNGNDGSRFQRHRLSLSAGDLVEFSLQGALLGRLALYDQREQLIGITSDRESLRRRIADDGDYLLVVSGSNERSYGPYDLVSRTLDLELSAPGTGLAGEGELNGWLQDESNQHTFTVEEAGLYQIELSSDDFDAYLELRGDSGVQREDDDSAGNLNARVSAFLEPGEYQLIAGRSYYADPAEGLYRLTASSKALAHELQHDGELPHDGTVYGWYDANLNYDREPLSYQLTLEDDAIVIIDMLADDFDSYLLLEGEGLFFSDDDSGNGTNARLRQRLSAGEYSVTALSYSSYGSAGLFELRTSVTATDEFPSNGRLELDEPLEAWLDSDAHDEYLLQIEEAGHYRLDMESDELDAYLELEGEALSLSNDDGGEDFNARIETHLTPGEYRVIARSYYGDDSGYYRLFLTLE